jgi:RNA polymerase sigma-70 factor, ECF subfamily
MYKSDEALMAAISRRRQQDFAELYQRYGAFVKHIAQEVIHNTDDVDDLVQEVFLEIWHEAGRFSPEKGKAVSWLGTIARRRAIDRLRKRQAYCRTKDRFETRLQVEGTRNGHREESSVSGNAVLHDLREFLVARMESLPAEQRSVIEMAFFGQCSQREIARKTKTPVGTVKTRFELGLRKLARAVQPISAQV